jgi:hypothetical protein
VVAVKNFDACAMKLLWRAHFTASRFTGSIVSVAEGGGDFPPLLQGRLMDEMQRTYRDVLGPQGLTASGLTEREIDVLRLERNPFFAIQRQRSSSVAAMRTLAPENNPCILSRTSGSD